MILRVDMHVHANLPRGEARAARRARRWWEAFRAHGIDAVVSTEHCYRDFRRAFAVLRRHAPPGAVVLPGVELLTREGVDLVAFHPDASLYDDAAILEPYGMEAEALAARLNAGGWAWYVPHPFTPGTTSVFRLGALRARRVLRAARGVELHNAALAPAIELSRRTRLARVLRKAHARALKLERLPRVFAPRDGFLAVGSDAHRPSCAGAALEIEADAATPAAVYAAILRNRSAAFHPRPGLPLLGALLSVQDVFSEWIAKRRLPGR
jgi:hypothetical protein